MDNIDKYKNYVLANDVTIRQLQDKLLEIFMYFKKICEDNGLNYWCGGGTMLGAVRHGGFIPWDDDLDVFMPRKDYESLYKIWNTIADTDHYALVRTDRSHNYHHTAMNLVDLKTTFIQFHSENEDTMVVILMLFLLKGVLTEDCQGHFRFIILLCILYSTARGYRIIKEECLGTQLCYSWE